MCFALLEDFYLGRLIVKDRDNTQGSPACSLSCGIRLLSLSPRVFQIDYFLNYSCSKSFQIRFVVNCSHIAVLRLTSVDGLRWRVDVDSILWNFGSDLWSQGRSISPIPRRLDLICSCWFSDPIRTKLQLSTIPSRSDPIFLISSPGKKCRIRSSR
jgi:hypothetical protein